MGWGLGEGVVKDGEDNDREYNYLEEEDQEYDKEAFRDDRAVKVSSKLVLLYTRWGWGLGEGGVKDGEDNDREYNYLEEEDQEYDKEDFRDDRAVKVSSKLFLLYNR